MVLIGQSSIVYPVLNPHPSITFFHFSKQGHILALLDRAIIWYRDGVNTRGGGGGVIKPPFVAGPVRFISLAFGIEITNA